MTRIIFALLAGIILLPSIAQAGDRDRVRTRAIAIDEEGVNDESGDEQGVNGDSAPDSFGYTEVEWTVRPGDVETVTEELTSSLAACGLEADEVVAAVTEADETKTAG